MSLQAFLSKQRSPVQRFVLFGNVGVIVLLFILELYQFHRIGELTMRLEDSVSFEQQLHDMKIEKQKHFLEDMQANKQKALMLEQVQRAEARLQDEEERRKEANVIVRRFAEHQREDRVKSRLEGDARKRVKEHHLESYRSAEQSDETIADALLNCRRKVEELMKEIEQLRGGVIKLEAN